MDIASSEEVKNQMRELSGDPKALPPQLCNGDEYCGVSACFLVRTASNDTYNSRNGLSTEF